MKTAFYDILYIRTKRRKSDAGFFCTEAEESNMLRDPNGKIATDCGMRIQEPTKGISVGAVCLSAVQEIILLQTKP